ncbi:hypothetical protein WICMUC_001012 [Wickerhamomyces mucosus]|uniref:Actin-related protein 5 n=1 Tax=Wickerhamomyces mucosus TaxID=1378264 RepID=A0A9P8PXH5_9ASCO|nr:hypothetical protein WICMUC_001012 [Wickerhamomyces mucosus]
MTSTPRDDQLSKRKVYDLRDHEDLFSSEPFTSPKLYKSGVPIGIDFGTSHVRIGLTNQKDPSNVFPTTLSRWRDRKLNKGFTFIGNDVNLDQSVRTQARSPYDGAFITNWDYVEQILDYSFKHAGVSSQGFVDNPVILTEKAGAQVLQRKGFYELLYESYGVKKVAFGIDDLFSYYQNNGKTGIVIGSGNESTHIIPVIDGKGLLAETKRINWGGRQSSNFLSSLIALKYPYFPTKISSNQIDNLVKDFCYVSRNYENELSKALSLDTLETFDITVEAPFTEIEKQQKSEEELARQAEKRKESGRRLQEQAQQKRLEKLIQKEQEFEYFSTVKEKLTFLSKKNQQALLKEENFDDEADFNKYLGNLEKSLKRARNQDVGEDETAEEPSFPLADIPDDELDEAQIKEKRRQKLMRANYEARQRAKREKEEEKLRLEKEAQEDLEWRQSDLQGWIHDRREKLKAIVRKRKDRAKLKEQLNDRKSHAAQLRMKSIASLASDDTSKSSNKRKRATIDNDPNDTFGTNDEDWLIYKDITSIDDEELLEEEETQLIKLEKELLEFDPNFTEEDTYEASYDWRKSTLHLFLRGPRPFNSEDSHEQHQIHLNIERIRVPEVLFQPSIAGLDQAGISEVSESILLDRSQGKGFSGDSYNVLQDIFLTGGQAHFKTFEERLHDDFRSFLPVGAPLKVRSAVDPILDPWRGIAKWSSMSEAENSYLTKQEYDEMGPDYIKEHNLGNASLI